MKLSREFYLDTDVVSLGKQLLGKVLVTNFGSITSGMIVETESYQGATDKASHAYGNRRTKRTETMFLAGGVGYVYLCYGMHHLFNIVTAPKNIPHAVLIRAIAPIDGIKVMQKRRKLAKPHKRLTAGPGVLTQALGITVEHDRCNLRGKTIWIEDQGIKVANDIQATPRIGIAYAKEHALLPWRFCLKNNPWLSN